ncbi:MAG: HYR domain-containing protein [Acidobacteria bacterium]|nr:HYR domain-containing protein [Acidobacteriota bacterium]
MRKRIGLALIVALIMIAIILGLGWRGRRVYSAARVPALFTVSSLSDSGAGSLRQAILDANATAGADTIDFQDELFGTITLTSGQLPAITEDLTITGPGPQLLTISGNNASRVFEVASGISVTLSGLTISNGTVAVGVGLANHSVSAVGGGLANNGVSVVGGGLYNNGGTLMISTCTLSNNAASGGDGGGLYSNGGAVSIVNSTLSNNSASLGGGVAVGGGTLTILNSTLSGNSASSSGGGIHINGGTANLSNTTLANNSASSSGGGIRNESAGTLNIKNSIVANSPSGGNVSNGGTINASGVNYSTDNSFAGLTQVTAAQLNLGPLQDNGGLTFTHALLNGSVAIDAVSDCTDLSSNAVTTDQRGVSRPVDGNSDNNALCDAGAYEAPVCTSGDTTPPTIASCPDNISAPTDMNQCSAVVVFDSPTATDNCPCAIPLRGRPLNGGEPCAVVCSPSSGSAFPKGTTTVTCTSTDAAGNSASCNFTVTVMDTQAPQITCTNIPASTATVCPPPASGVVTYPAPQVSDNCPGASVVCSPASGSTFPTGTTTVTCTATDASNNTASCSFTLNVFSGCLQDDTNRNNVIFFNLTTGAYRFCCNGAVYTGVGKVTVRGCVYIIEHYTSDRRVLVKVDSSVKSGTASLQTPPGTTRCLITDRDIRNNSCSCP